MPVPHPLAYPLAELLWAAGLGEAPGGFLDYVRYPFVADGEKARRELGFEARHASREALDGLPGLSLSRARRRREEPAARGRRRELGA